MIDISLKEEDQLNMFWIMMDRMKKHPGVFFGHTPTVKEIWTFVNGAQVYSGFLKTEQPDFNFGGFKELIFERYGISPRMKMWDEMIEEAAANEGKDALALFWELLDEYREERVIYNKRADWSTEKLIEASMNREIIIQIRYFYSSGYIWSKKQGTYITKNGIHEGILTNGKVYCDVYPEGLPYAQWINDFEALGECAMEISPLDGKRIEIWPDWP